MHARSQRGLQQFQSLARHAHHSAHLSAISAHGCQNLHAGGVALRGPRRPAHLLKHHELHTRDFVASAHECFRAIDQHGRSRLQRRIELDVQQRTRVCRAVVRRRLRALSTPTHTI
eukprot:5035408-Pleurochrysis_carterae.AAC.1